MSTVNNYEINLEEINGDNTNVENQTLLSIEKQILLQDTFEGTLLAIEKGIIAEFSGTLLPIEKQILDANNPLSFYERNGWEPIITLGSLTVRSDQLTGLVKITTQEDDNYSATFTIILFPAIYDLYSFQGAPVTISIRKNDRIYRKFTGIVDTPVIDVIGEKLTLNCISDRRVLINNLSSLEPFVGYYSPTVLGENTDTYERMSARLSTIAGSLDFNGYNNPFLTSYTPKSVPDFSLGSSEVYRRNPQIILESSSKIVNQISITVNYSYQRCHQKIAVYQWDHPYKPSNTEGTGGICPFLQARPSMPTKELIRSSAQGAGWVLGSDILFGRQFKTGTYQCNGIWAGWSTIETAGFFSAPIQDANGDPVLDGSGNPLSRSVPIIVADNTDLYTMSANWNASKRFNQTVEESYTFTIKSPRSQSIYGLLSSSESYSYSDPVTIQEWEAGSASTPIPSGVTLNYSTSGLSFFFNASFNRPTFNSVIICALNKAKVEIMKNHRDTSVIFQRDISPEIELYHTVELTGKWMRAKGKCRRIEHNMCVSKCSAGKAGEAYSEIELAQYRGVGSIAETPLQPPAPIPDIPDLFEISYNLETHLGIDPSLPGSENWTGYVGNISKQVPIPGGGIDNIRTNYQESFIVTTPPIPDAERNQRDLAGTATYNINIPTDDTEYEAYG